MYVYAKLSMNICKYICWAWSSPECVESNFKGNCTIYKGQFVATIFTECAAKRDMTKGLRQLSVYCLAIQNACFPVCSVMRDRIPLSSTCSWWWQRIQEEEVPCRFQLRPQAWRITTWKLWSCLLHSLKPTSIWSGQQNCSIHMFCIPDDFCRVGAETIPSASSQQEQSLPAPYNRNRRPAAACWARSFCALCRLNSASVVQSEASMYSSPWAFLALRVRIQSIFYIWIFVWLFPFSLSILGCVVFCFWCVFVSLFCETRSHSLCSPGWLGTFLPQSLKSWDYRQAGTTISRYAPVPYNTVLLWLINLCMDILSLTRCVVPISYLDVGC